MTALRKSAILLLFLSLSAFFSCADSEPQLSGVDAFLVLEYPDQESEPSVRFSVFGQTNSNVTRAVQIKTIHLESGQEWVCSEPRKISDNKRKYWAGYTNFVPAQGSTIPPGKYSFTYEDAAGRQVESSFTLVYDETLLKTNVSSLKAMQGPSFKEKVAVYNADGLLVYYGDRKDKWKNNTTIRNEYSTAATMRTCYVIAGSNVVCMLPPVDLE